MKGKQITTLYDHAAGRATGFETEVDVLDESTLGKQIESKVIGVYPTYKYQTFEGYGCAMTETSCWLLSQMAPEVRREALLSWFGSEGMDARFVRMHIDSCVPCPQVQIVHLMA